MSDSGSNEGWWLSTTGTAEGPYSGAFLRAGLRSGAIPATAHACRVRGEEWKQLVDWDDFRDAVSPTGPLPPSPRPAAPDLSGSPLTNRQLPAMANWICTYAIAVAPVLFLINQLSCCVTGTTYKDTSEFFGWEVIQYLVSGVISLVSTSLLVVGGLRLRALRRSGPVLILTAIWFGFGANLLLLIVTVGVTFSSTQEDFTDSTTAQTLIGFLLIVVGIAEFVFLIASLIWLHRNRHSLPLADA